ncbi:TPA: hypothetical protein QCY05_000866 [Bacillus wiedmannii]|nr:hypothetical protein [Bacillus wiedmannii]
MVVKKNVCFFLCFILPPIGAIYILLNREALQKRDFILYVLFAAINLSLMIFDRSMWIVAGHYVLGVIVIVFSNMNKR